MNLPPGVPDVSRWTENLAYRTAVRDSGKIVISAKFFFRFDLKNPDARFQKLMEQCVAIFAFGVEAIVKQWTVYAEDGTGKIEQALLSALLIDRINDKWVIGLQNENWSSEIKYDDNNKIAGMTFALKTADGLRSVYIRNPDYKK